MKNKSIYLFLMIVLFPFYLKGQIVLKKITNTDPLKNCILIYQENGDQLSLIDSFMMFINHSEYSCGEYSGTIYISWCQTGFYSKSYQINTYSIYNKSLKLEESLYIDDFKHKKIFSKGMSLKIVESGLCLSFQEGKVKKIILSFDELNMHTLPQVLKKLSKL